MNAPRWTWWEHYDYPEGVALWAVDGIYGNPVFFIAEDEAEAYSKFVQQHKDGGTA